MMNVFTYPAKQDWPEIMERPAADHAVLEKSVQKILQKVKAKGDKAVKKFTKEFDGAAIKKIQVTADEINAAILLVPEELKKAMLLAKNNIERFHATQQEEIKKTETLPGVVCWRQSKPVEKIGLYIPGGTAPLFSTVLMLATPAQLAGCKEIILCTPPSKDSTVNPAILYAAQLCGVTKIFKAGGVQAIGAMAYGTKTVPKVFKIFGPGNQYVTLAKQLVQQEGTAIDIPAGPSELLVIADDTAVPAYVAADLLSQAEHGTDSQVILVTTSKNIAEKVMLEIKKQLGDLPRKKIAAAALKNSKLVLVKNLQQAVELSDFYAPEHLILCCANPEETAQQINSAGSVFIGNYSPESAGDYASGTNHTLPTNGYAAMYSGVSLDSFIKKITCQQLTKEGLHAIGTSVMAMAAAEGLEAHKRAVAIRLKD